MKQFTVLIALAFALFIVGCASTPKGRAVQLVVVSDGVADEVATQWDEQGHARIDKCRAEGFKSDADRVKCMGVFALVKDKLVLMLEGLVTAQTAVKLAVKCADVNTCKDEPDWKALESKLQEAIEALRPILQEIRK